MMRDPVDREESHASQDLMGDHLPGRVDNFEYLTEKPLITESGPSL